VLSFGLEYLQCGPGRAGDHAIRGIAGAVVLLQDITESRKIEEALEERVTRLVALGVQRERAVHRPRRRVRL
jgi:hypothetical protein